VINHVADGMLAFKYENLSSESLSKNSKIKPNQGVLLLLGMWQ
jgi:hypothetical protein